MQNLNDGDRELWLSQYIDNELDDDARAAVAEKLRTDLVWRVEFDSMQGAERLVGAATRRFHEDDGFSQAVIAVVKTNAGARKIKQPLRLTQRKHRIARSSTNWPLRFAAMTALCCGAVFIWHAYTVRPGHDSNTAALKSPFLSRIEVTEETRSVSWPDGTNIVARRGSIIQGQGERSVKLSGEALFHVARSATPFIVNTDGKYQFQALGTRFDVKNTPEGMRVRVAEGHVRVSAADSDKTVDAFGGTEVLPGLQTKSFDPRVVSVAWGRSPNSAKGAGSESVENVVPPWSQLGGSASHTSTTPLRGPANLVTQRTPKFYEFPSSAGGQWPVAGVVLSSENNAFVLLNGKAGKTKLLQLSLIAPDSGWKTWAEFSGTIDFPPVLTPRNLVVVATSNGVVTAYKAAGETVWSHNESGMVQALCASPDGMILLSTPSGLTALNDQDGSVIWRFAGMDIQAPATILANNLICTASRYGGMTVLDRAGQVVNKFKWSRETSHAPVAAASGSEVWLTSNDGYVAKVSIDKGLRDEKYFGWHLKCDPILSGLLGIGSAVMGFDRPAAVTAPAEDTVVAIVQDGRNEIYAGYRGGVLHWKAPTPAAAMAEMKEPEFTSVAKGEVVKSGLALFSGNLIVTTSRGIQIFE